MPTIGNGVTSIRCHFPASPFVYSYWASEIANSIMFGESCLLWITEFGIWPSSENWSLFNRLRLSYGESASLEDRPGQLFAGDEVDDLANFLQLSALFGWGGYLSCQANRAHCFFSHDEFIDFFSSDESLISELRARLATK